MFGVLKGLMERTLLPFKKSYVSTRVSSVSKCYCYEVFVGWYSILLGFESILGSRCPLGECLGSGFGLNCRDSDTYCLYFLFR
jgi:hypothetical protein